MNKGYYPELKHQQLAFAGLIFVMQALLFMYFDFVCPVQVVASFIIYILLGTGLVLISIFMTQ